MKRLYIGLFIGLTIIALGTLSSCRKTPSCPESKTTTQDLTDSSMSKVPYTGYDTLYFLNKQGDTCIVKGNGKQYYYNIETVLASPDCPDNYNNVQGYAISFTSVKGELYFKLNLEDREDLRIDVKRYRDYYFYFTGEIGVIRSPKDPLYIDSMMINNVLFRTISRAYVSNNKYEAYYNKESGLLKIVNNEVQEEYSIIK